MVANQNMEIIDMKLIMAAFPWIVTTISIVGCYLNAKKKISCWPLWIGTAILNSFYFSFYKPDYGVALLWIAYIGFDAFGWREWRKK